MTPDDLRALADALERMAQLERYGSPGALALESATAYLRAQADAQPVAWMHIDGRVISAATMDQAYRDGGAMQSSLREYTIPLYTHPAPAVPQAEPMTQAAQDVLAERRRQIEVEGWTPEHDDAEHLPDELALAAASYICADEGDAPPAIWPWDRAWWKPSTPRRNLVKAGALILAEIERLDRMGGSDAE